MCYKYIVILVLFSIIFLSHVNMKEKFSFLLGEEEKEL